MLLSSASPDSVLSNVAPMLLTESVTLVCKPPMVTACDCIVCKFFVDRNTMNLVLESLSFSQFMPIHCLISCRHSVLCEVSQFPHLGWKEDTLVYHLHRLLIMKFINTLITSKINLCFSTNNQSICPSALFPYIMQAYQSNKGLSQQQTSQINVHRLLHILLSLSTAKLYEMVR